MNDLCTPKMQFVPLGAGEVVPGCLREELTLLLHNYVTKVSGIGLLFILCSYCKVVLDGFYNIRNLSLKGVKRTKDEDEKFALYCSASDHCFSKKNIITSFKIFQNCRFFPHINAMV